MKCTIIKKEGMGRDKLEEFFSVFLENMTQFIGNNQFRATIKEKGYKDIWINDIINDENSAIFEYRDDDSKLIGFIVMSIGPNENYVKDFHVTKEYQGDGKSFFEMLKRTVMQIDNKNDYVGDIWASNDHSSDVFKHLGAKFDGEKFRVDYETLSKYMNR